MLCGMGKSYSTMSEFQELFHHVYREEKSTRTPWQDKYTTCNSKDAKFTGKYLAIFVFVVSICVAALTIGISGTMGNLQDQRDLSYMQGTVLM